MLPELLIPKIGAGDHTALRQLYTLFEIKVYNTALAYLQDVPDAEETVQDVFIEVYHSAAKFEGRSSASTWIYRITINKCLDRIRHRNRKKRFAFISSLSNTPAEPANFDHPGVQTDNREKARYLFDAIRQLPDTQQTAFILKQVEGLPQKEVAAIMQLNEKAVESLIQRAKQNLRKTLQEFYNETKGK
jgi:RNA polymerase sigma-70 factor (ECF subfamily)